MYTMSTPAFDRAVARAMLAPSVHNTQPWRFVLRPTGLEILADRTRQLPVLDPSGRQLLLSLGCAVFNARVSLAAGGFAIRVERLPDEAHPELVARITITRMDGSDCVDRELASLDAAIESRQTNRRAFIDNDVPADLLTMLVAMAAAEGAMLTPVTSSRDRHRLAQLWREADGQQLADPAYRAELRAWTSTDPSRRDGVPARTVPHVDVGSGDDVPMRDFDTDGTGWLPTETHSTEDQCLLMLGTAAENPLAWLRAGEALEHVWLETTRAGYMASLFTQAIEIAPIRERLRADLQLPSYPHVLLRIGRAAVTAAASRRPIRDVYVTETGGT
jgi:nitroreductase